MPQVLTTNAVITCPHGGLGRSTPSSTNWTVDGAPVLVEGDTGVLSCVFPVPCVGYTLQSMGLNATEINGAKVILVSDFNQSRTGMPLTMTEAHQTFDDSSPAPIANGAPVPPVAPAMADESFPAVSAFSSSPAFNSTTQTPPVITMTFNLSTPFPSQWQITLLSEVPAPGSSRNLTNGAPGAVPAPPGGAWSSPALTVVLTLTLPFLNALAPGLHHFYVTGVNQRGHSGIALADLAVS